MEANMPDEHYHVSFDSAIEALIFAAEEPVSGVDLARSWSDAMGLEQPSVSEVQDAVDRINARLVESERPYRIESWGGGFRFATRKEVAPFLRALFITDRQRKLSRTLMESLAILAYRQPVSRSELEFVRGVDCDYAVRKLLEYGLVDVVGRSERVGRPLLYGTTDKFLELFGLHTLDELPNLRELESILDDPAFQKEKARLLMTTGVQLPLLERESGAEEDASNVPVSGEDDESGEVRRDDGKQEG
ncbi:MAG: SMC-Scp complex subunit ScpB [Bacteroidetes bacterium]|nr:SMC-Scp complex subunit ScpB [Bacteroidota bacterium]MDA1333492.1 SMC-Scp complex subunit ScpB [Bacteroidota bacterium]